jgi:hypothetical protein
VELRGAPRCSVHSEFIAAFAAERGVKRFEQPSKQMKIWRRLRVFSASAAITMLPSILAGQPQTDSLLIGDGRIGDVIMGMTIDSLYRTVRRERTRLIDRFREGLFDPAIEIRLGQPNARPTIVAEVTMSKCGLVVGRIEIYDPHFRTASGLHVGSTLADVRKQHPVKISNEEGLRAYSEDLPMTFELAGVQPTAKVHAITVIRKSASATCGSR